MYLMAFSLLIVGLIAGFLIGFLLKKSKEQPIDRNENQEELNTFKQEIGTLKGRLSAAVENYKEQKGQIDRLNQENRGLIAEKSQIETTNQNLTHQLNQQKEEVGKLQEKFTNDFTLVANRLLKQNASEFAEANQKKLDDILSPLKENIKAFEQKVDDKYEKELKERTSLIEQIKSLEKLNTQMSEETQNLTKALKGDNKAQGNWGELILEKVLESSGLVEGVEFQTQAGTVNDEGKRILPDVRINLPEGKHIIVDSKVSLIAYQGYINTEEKEEQLTYLKQHLTSVKTHIKGLSEKHYTTSKDVNSPDFVLLFMPIESSFGLAMRTDNELYQYAWDRKVVVVTPSNGKNQESIRSISC